MELLKCEIVPKPPLVEQKAISEYLDGINKMFRSYIHSKQQVIKLLNEQKQAIINKAVTKGINSKLDLNHRTLIG
jgi:type I restriction enzyme S subunit